MRFLFQVKRFFLILWEESFLFIIRRQSRKKQYPTDKLGVFQKKGLPNFGGDMEIRLEQKTYDFYTLQPKNEEPFYVNSPLFGLVKKNRKNIFENLVKIFEYSHDFRINIGLEFEFYLLGKTEMDIVKELKKLLPNVLDVEKERGCSQYEIKTKPSTDMLKLAKDYNNMISTIKKFAKENNLGLDFSATPFESDCGSALQVNLSLTDGNGKNLFARSSANGESELLLNVLGGLLKNINANLLLYINDETCLDRFDAEKNMALKNSGKYPAPTFVSWGINNRTAAIRIPTPSVIDIEKYKEEDDKGRRLEYRIPSASADIYLVLIGIISSALEGLANGLYPPIEKTAFDVMEKNEGLEQIVNDFSELNDIFSIETDVLFFNKIP